MIVRCMSGGFKSLDCFMFFFGHYLCSVVWFKIPKSLYDVINVWVYAHFTN